MMKKLFILLFVMSGVTFGLVSCKEETQTQSVGLNEVLDSKDNKTPCCEVQCRRGSCRTYESPCNCTCVAGQPVCGALGNGGSPGQKGGTPKIVVEATPEMMALYDADIQYIEQTLHNTEAAQALRNIKQLLVDNQYVLSTSNAISAYVDNVGVYEQFINTQPDEVIDRLSDWE